MATAAAEASGKQCAAPSMHGNHLGVLIITTDASGQVAIPSGYPMAGFPITTASAIMIQPSAVKSRPTLLR
jgi:hypothetical protein